MTIRIAGAGPAGLAAAITLALAGRDVEVHERRADCGARFGGDLQGLENWSDDVDVLAELREAGLPADFYAAPLTAAIQTNGRRDDRLEFAHPGLYLVKRGREPDSLDQALKRGALSLGVRLHFRASLDSGHADIAATGPLPHARSVFAVDKGIVFDTDAPDMAVVLLDEDAAPKGYAYLLVTNGYGCLCTMSFEDFATTGARFMRARDLLAGRYDIRISNPRPVGGIGYFAFGARLRAGRALLVGEAGGLQDLLWGFGIRTAIRSGILAARCFVEGRDWERAARASFGNRQRASIVNRFLWELLARGDHRLLMTLLRRGGPYALLHSFARFNLFQRLAFPVARARVRRSHPRLAI